MTQCQELDKSRRRYFDMRKGMPGSSFLKSVFVFGKKQKMSDFSFKFDVGKITSQVL